MKLYQKILLLSILFLFPLFVSARESMNITMISTGIDGDVVLLESNGEYLLMDTATYDSSEPLELINYLVDHNIFQFSVYISHYHTDHYGGLKNIIEDDRFTIKKVYLPKTEYVCKVYQVDSPENEPDLATRPIYNNYKNTNTRFKLIKEKNIPYEFLWPTNTPYPEEEHCFRSEDQEEYLNEVQYKNEFTIGLATIHVIGPLNNFSYEYYYDHYLNNQAQTDDEYRVRLQKNHYFNNNSLVSIVEADGIRFLTAGDIFKAEEEILVKAAQNGQIDLKADIYKLSHHGSNDSNRLPFLKMIQPKYSFVMNDSWTESGTNHGSSLNPIINPQTTDCDKDCYPGSNVLISAYNGTTTFQVKDGNIFIDSEKENKKITIQYYNQESDELIDERVYEFSTGTPYYMNQDYKYYEGYTYVDINEELPEDGTILEEDHTFRITMKKNINPNTGSDVVVSIPDTLQNKNVIFTFISIVLIVTGVGIFLFTINHKSKNN